MTRSANQRGEVNSPSEITPNTIFLEGISYYAPPYPKGRLQGQWPSDHSITPATLTSVSHRDICASVIPKTLEEFLKIDDVYSTVFTSLIIIQIPSATASQEFSQHNDQGMLLEFSVNGKIITTPAICYEGDLPPGPYFVRDGLIHEAWRLYCDNLDVFEITVVPHVDTDGAKFSILTALSTNGIWKNVAVPSRLYARPSIQNPLAGARISVKDNFGLAGVKTTMRNRAFTELYPDDNETAAYAIMLLKMGAIVIGEEPTDQWIDFHCPFNPRGDEYQNPGSSFSGAAASLAGYSWLDCSIGTDAAGSIRDPAAKNGLYGFRPTFGSGPFDGIFHLARTFDTIGLLGRDLPSLYRLACITMSLNKPQKYPRKILYPKEFFPTMNDSQQAILDKFVSVLENLLDVKRTKFSITDAWSNNPPTVAKGKSLQEYLKKIGSQNLGRTSTYQVYYHDAYHEFDKFREDYRSAHGKEPYVGPIVRFHWNIGSTISSEERDQAEFELNTFRVWFRENVLKESSDSLSEAVLVLPAGKATPDYRDEPNPPPSILEILGENTIAMVLGIPHLVLPFGQLPYESRVNGRTEYRPISVSLIGAKGSDAMLMRLACDAFEKADWPTVVQTGRYTFPLGMGVRNVAEI